MGLSIFFYQEREGSISICKPMKMEFIEVPSGQTVEPSLHIPEYASNEFVKAIQEELDKNGIKTESELTIIGELRAKDKHLQDMRRLVFKNGGKK